jgi:hypothetical protein
MLSLRVTLLSSVIPSSFHVAIPGHLEMTRVLLHGAQIKISQRVSININDLLLLTKIELTATHLVLKIDAIPTREGIQV